jgi:hypothetical protein
MRTSRELLVIGTAPHFVFAAEYMVFTDQDIPARLSDSFELQPDRHGSGKPQGDSSLASGFAFGYAVQSCTTP